MNNTIRNEGVSSSMIEEVGHVTARYGDRVWVSTERRSACEHCGVAGSCGTSVVSRMFMARRLTVCLRTDVECGTGDQVVLGLPQGTLFAASALVFLAPLLTMIFMSAWPRALGYGDGASAASGFAGLVLGLVIAKAISSFGGVQRIFRPVVLRRVGVGGLSRAA